MSGMYLEPFEPELTPASGLRIKPGDRVQFTLDPQFCPEGGRTWSFVGTGERVLQTDGKVEFVSRGSARDGDFATVICEVKLEGVVVGRASSTLFYETVKDEWQTLAEYSVRASNFPNAQAGLYANGYQQLQLIVTMTLADADLTPAEIATLRLFEAETNQELPFMAGLELGDGPALWGVDNDRNEYDLAAPNSRYASQRETGHSSVAPQGTQTKTFYLRSLAGANEDIDVYLGLRDRHGLWHYSTDNTGQNYKQIKVSPVIFRPTGTYQLDLRQVANGQPSAAQDDYYDRYPWTIDYWVVKVTPVSVKFKACTVRDTSNSTVLRSSMARWESDHQNEIMFSCSGVIFRENASASIRFDTALTNFMQRNGQTLSTSVDVSQIHVGEVAFTNHRYKGVRYDGALEAALNTSLSAELRDSEGNLHMLVITYPPRTSNGHRDRLTVTRV
ncbi:hypothetical protein [Pseudomonas sp. microsymbiont 2]